MHLAKVEIGYGKAPTMPRAFLPLKKMERRSMKLKWTVLLVLAAAVVARGGENVFTRKAIVALMVKANAYRKAHPWRRASVRYSEFTGS